MLNRQYHFGGHEANAHFLSFGGGAVWRAVSSNRRGMCASLRSVRAFGDACKSADGSRPSRAFSFWGSAAAMRHENEGAMEEKSSHKSICLPKSTIFVGGSGEQSISGGEGMARSVLIKPRQGLWNGRPKRQMLFTALVFYRQPRLSSGHGRGQVSSESIHSGEILGGSQPKVGYVPLRNRRREIMTHAFFVSALADLAKGINGIQRT